MAIDQTTFLTEIQGELEEYGQWDTALGGALDTNLLYAMQDLWEKRDWSFKFLTGTITTTEGIQGPYDPPADFDSLVTPEVVSRYYDYDRFAVPAPIPDDANGYKFEITWDRLNNKIYFRRRPPAQTFTFYYRGALAATAAIATWPLRMRRFLRLQTMYYCLLSSEDTTKQAKQFEADADRAYKSMLHDDRRGESKQDTREPRDVMGYPLHQGYANDGDGFMGGEC